MKTLKITEEAHKKLTKIQTNYYQITGKKLTFSELLEKIFESEFKHNDKSKK